MGARGPVSLPNDVLTARGSSLTARRRKAERRTIGKDDRLVCPDWLDDESRKCWHSIVTALQPYGLLRDTDAHALERYAHMQTMWQRLTKARDAAQAADDPQTARLERRVLKLCATLLALETALGLTPAARARLGLPLQPPGETDGNRLLRLLPHRSESS